MTDESIKRIKAALSTAEADGLLRATDFHKWHGSDNAAEALVGPIIKASGVAVPTADAISIAEDLFCWDGRTHSMVSLWGDNPSPVYRALADRAAQLTNGATAKERGEIKAVEMLRRREGNLDLLGGRFDSAERATLVEPGLWRDTEPMKALKQWSTGSRPFLLLSGGAGLGKSFAAAAWLLAARKGRGQWLDERELVRLSAALYDSGNQPVTRYESVLSVPMLVVDEWCRRTNPDPAGRDLLHDLLTRRVGEDRRTILITNASQAEFSAKRLDGPISSRFAKYVDAVEVGGADLRRATA